MNHDLIVIGTSWGGVAAPVSMVPGVVLGSWLRSRHRDRPHLGAHAAHTDVRRLGADVSRRWSRTRSAGPGLQARINGNPCERVSSVPGDLTVQNRCSTGT